jgi:5-hydroxyisourate hydrolase
MGRLSTHVLDTTRGRPAAAVEVEVLRLEADGGWRSLKKARTNVDGRTDEPLLAGPALVSGTYMLNFSVGDYFRGAGALASEPPFLDVVPLRFTIADPDANFHVPLIVTPWSYSTYRGS